MRNPDILRDFLVALTAAMFLGIVTARVVVWWQTRMFPTPPGEPPYHAMVWDLLAEARQITIDAVENGGA
jgi:hypothetical protein